MAGWNVVMQAAISYTLQTTKTARLLQATFEMCSENFIKQQAKMLNKLKFFSFCIMSCK